NGYSEAAAFFPDRIEAGIINGDELAGFVTIAEAEILQNFQTASAAANGIPELGDLLGRKICIIDPAEINLREDNKAVRIRLDHFIDDPLKFFAPQASEDGDLLYIGLIHATDDFGRTNFLAMDAPRIIDMIVDVDYGEFCAGNFMAWHVQHRLRVEIFEQKGHIVGGIWIGGILYVL